MVIEGEQMRDDELAELAKKKMVEMLDAGANGVEVLNAMTGAVITSLTETRGPIETARILRELADAVITEHSVPSRLN